MTTRPDNVDPRKQADKELHHAPATGPCPTDAVTLASKLRLLELLAKRDINAAIARVSRCL